MTDLFQEPIPIRRAITKEEPAALYEYRDTLNQLVAIKGRFEYQEGHKNFKWKLPDSKNWNGLGEQNLASLPLWGAELLQFHVNGFPLFLVEGEKAATACRDHELWALTHAGGAGTTDFGDSLQVLKGKNVVLWPDNDEPGRRYMARLHTALKPIAKNITIISPPAPPKGDAFDYFASGGKAEDLLASIPVGAPVVDYLAYDAVRVRQPSSMGTIEITFTNMEKTARELVCEAEVGLGDNAGDPYSQRLNMLSGSQVTEMRRNLDTIFGKELGWAQLLNTGIALARKAFMEQDLAIRLINITEPGPPKFVIPELLPEGLPTVWFGDGSSLKTYLALRVAMSVAGGYEFLGYPVRKGAAMLIDYENPADTFKFRCNRLFAGMRIEPEDLPLFHWPARGIPLADQIEAIRKKVEDEGITVVIVDSAASACGGKPEDADIALKYFMALQKLGAGVTTLTVAHCTKAGDDQSPLGSIFWTNQPRRTINFKRTDDEDSDEIDVGIFVRKVNDGRKPKPFSMHIKFEGSSGPVTISSSDISAVPQLDADRKLKYRVWDILREPMTLGEILTALGEDETDKGGLKRLDTMLRRETKKFVRAASSGPGRGHGDITKWARVWNED